MSQEPFLLDLDKVLLNKVPKVYKNTPHFIINYLKRKLHIDELNEILTIYADKDGVDFTDSCIEYFNLKLDVKGLDSIPLDGRYIFVSNHPLGGLDGICLSSIIGNKFDKKIRYIVNDVLYYIKNLQSIFLPVNKLGKQTKNNTAKTNEAFESDNQIITFPAGICSRKTKGRITDLEWKKNFLIKAKEYKRDVVPIYFDGHNSNFFYKLANIRKRLGIKFNIEIFFLSDEMFKNKNQTFSITFGEPIAYTFFDKSKSDKEWVQYVREKAYNLADSSK